MDGYIHSTESFGTVDGPGIRFVVFMQGCPMRCLYCHNPDTWRTNCGTLRSTDDILKEYDGVKEFLKSGGITVTGGEPLMQIDFVTELFEKAKKHGINTCLDTSGITFQKSNSELIDKFDRLMNVTDTVMLDIKHIDNDAHIKLTGHSNKNILEFAEYLAEKPLALWIRHVVVYGITYNDDYLKRLGFFMGGLKNLKALDVLPYHNMGEVKYKSLDIPYPLADTAPTSKEDAEHARSIIISGIKNRLRQ